MEKYFDGGEIEPSTALIISTSSASAVAADATRLEPHRQKTTRNPVHRNMNHLDARHHFLIVNPATAAPNTR